MRPLQTTPPDLSPDAIVKAEDAAGQGAVGVIVEGQAVADDEEYMQVGEYGEEELVDDVAFE